MSAKTRHSEGPGGMADLFIMAGGGTGGHVLPLLAVAEELRSRGHDALFLGTKRGIEARLVPAKGFSIEYIRNWRVGGSRLPALARHAVAVAMEHATGAPDDDHPAAARCFQHGRLCRRSDGHLRVTARDSRGRHGAKRGAREDESPPGRYVRKTLLGLRKRSATFRRERPK